jgi:hypothetical protein
MFIHKCGSLNSVNNDIKLNLPKYTIPPFNSIDLIYLKLIQCQDFSVLLWHSLLS